MSFHIEKVEQVPFAGFQDLLIESTEEAYQFLNRLVEEWESGRNRFAHPGEGLYRIRIGGQVVGIGGINRDPYSGQNQFGRIRRFYIKKAFRGQGIGGILLEHIMSRHEESFDAIGLRTDSEMAGKFYEKYGFELLDNYPNHSHMKWRSSDSSKN